MKLHIGIGLWVAFVCSAAFGQDAPIRFDFSGMTAEENDISVAKLNHGSSPLATVSFGVVPTDPASESMSDGQGAIVSAGPGEGVMLRIPAVSSTQAALIRCSVQSNSPDMLFTLSVIDQNNAGSIVTRSMDWEMALPNRYQRLGLLFYPPSTGFFSVLQFLNTSPSVSAVAYLDNIEIFLLDGDQFYSGQFLSGADPEIKSIRLSDPPLPSPTPSSISEPTSIPNPTLTPTPPLSPTPTLTPTPTQTSRPTPTPTPARLFEDTVNPETGLVEITMNLKSLPDGAQPITLVQIPVGTYFMGSSIDSASHFVNEKPLHYVSLTRNFYIGKHEVTRGQWNAVMGITSSDQTDDLNKPVEQVSWEDCQAFLTKMNAAYPGVFRLPSEAEWEYACRARSTTRYYWGEDLSEQQLGDHAWYSGNNTPAGAKVIGLKSPNAWGLYDMSGNAWEICMDGYGLYSQTEQIDPLLNESLASCVIRGGCYKSGSVDCRSARRTLVSRNNRFQTVGFRIVCTSLVLYPPTPTPTSTPTPDIFSTPTPVATATGSPAPTATPTFSAMIEVTQINPQTHLEEIRVLIPNLPVEALSLEMVRIPAGSFSRGTPEGEANFAYGEKPQHGVTLTEPFYLGKYEITQAQWQTVMGNNPSYFGPYPNQPVETLTWFDAARFCNRLSRIHQRTAMYDEETWAVNWGANGFRLPSEAEWEYACRAGTGTRFYWGDDPEYGESVDYSWSEKNNQPEGTKTIGLKKPNPWGLFDMSGNVEELCTTFFENYTADEQMNPTGPSWGLYRVSRGGSWLSPVSSQRSAARRQYSSNYKYFYTGLRIALPVNGVANPQPTPTPLSSPNITIHP